MLANAKNYIGKVPKKRLYLYLFIFVGIVGASVIGLSFVQRESYAPLFSGLSIEEASSVVSRLKELKVPYRLAMNGTTIYVPKDKVYEVRLMLASSNLLPAGGTGFELFDKTNYGMTEFLQNVNYKRAIQGELQRTINQMPEIRGSRVHIAIPEKTLFKEKEKDVTASVFLRLKEGRSLSQEQIMSIVYLVAASVEGLRPENVIVVDSQGRVLYRQEPSSSFHAQTAHQLEIQRGVERKIEDSVQALLDRAIGVGRSIVRANVELNFRKVEETREEYIPEKTVVREEKRSKERNVNRTREEKGVPGVASNLQAKGEKEAASDTQSQAEREESQIAYELSRTIKKIAEPVGEIKRISIAVLVDGRYERVKGEKQEEIKYIPRTEKEIQDIRNLVARACGLEESRGDKIEVLNMPFETEPFTDETPIIEKMERRELYLAAAKYGFYALIFISFLLFFLRPILGLLKARNELPYGVRDVVVREATEARALEEKRQEELPEAMKNKELVSAIVKAWVREGT